MSRYSDQIIADGGANLLGYWPLDAEFGVTDKSTGGHNGTAAGGVTIGSATGPGELTATDFDGAAGASADRITTAFNPFASGSVRSYELWANIDTLTSIRTVFAGDVANSPWLRIATDGILSWRPDNGTGGNRNEWSGTALATTGQWVHVLLVHDTANGPTLYINGVSQGAGAVSGTGARAYNATPGNILIAAQGSPSTTLPFDGKLAHVAVYNGDFSAMAGVHYNAGVWQFAPAIGPAPYYSVA